MPTIEADSRPLLHIAVGIVRDAEGRILISRRRAGKHGAGLWEFPGGKLDDGEAVLDALKRELHEELGVFVSAAQPLISIRHSYPDRHVLLDTWDVTAYEGVPTSMEGQAIAWAHGHELGSRSMLPADAPIIGAINLPDRYLITGSFESDADTRRRLQRAVGQGVRLARLRFPELDDARYAAAAASLVPWLQQQGCRVMVGRAASLAESVGADGLHLTSTELLQGGNDSNKSEHLARLRASGSLLAASCHGGDELRRAEKLNCDFCVLSPVLEAHPPDAVRPALGWSGFKALVHDSNLPVYALGGVAMTDLGPARDAGGQGIAGIRAFRL